MPNRQGVYPDGSASILGNAHPVVRAAGGRFSPPRGAKWPAPQPLNMVQRGQVLFGYGAHIAIGGSFVACGVDQVYQGVASSSMDPGERVVSTSVGAAAVTFGTGYTIFQAGQTAAALGATGTGVKLTAVGLTMARGGSIPMAFGVGIMGGRSVDYVTGNRISAGAATGLLAIYETAKAPFSWWNGEEVYPCTRDAAALTWNGNRHLNFWGTSTD